MSHKNLLIAATLLICVGLQGCHHSSKNRETAPTPPSSNAPLSLGPQQVLDRTQVSSETDAALEVNSGAVTLAGTDEISDPIVINR